MPISGLVDIRNQLPSANPQNKAFRPLAAIGLIVVHYDAVKRPAQYDPIQRYKDEANYHIHKDWSVKPGVTTPIYGFGLMYHVKIDAWGKKYQTQPFELITWHARAGNASGLAICVDLGDNQDPTPEQLKALHEVLDDCIHKCPEFPAAREDVFGHKEVRTNSTACPGRLLPYVQKYRAKQW